MNSPDDTQPLATGGQTGRPPAFPIGRPRAARRAPRLLLTIILTTSCTLVFTLVLFVRALSGASEARIGAVQVSIERNGELQTVSTRLDTVGALLAELALLPFEEGALSLSADARLVDGMVIRILPPRSVTIAINAAQRQFQTALENPAAILDSAGIAVDAGDKIWVNGALADYDALPAWTVPARHIRIRRAARLTIIDDSVQSTIVTNADTIGDALYEAGLTLYLTDQVTPPLDAAPADLMTIRIKRALPIKLLVDGVTINARTSASLVRDALIKLDAPIFGLDYVLPPEDTPVSENMTIEIVRVTEDIVSESAAIDFSVVTRLDDSLNLDEVAVLQEGRAGRQETRYRVRIENGVEVERELTETALVEAPLDKIVAYGGKVAPIGTVPGAGLSYWRRICALATFYDPESQGGSRSTATGATLQKGVIAAKPHIIPYYTSVYVPGYGQGTIRDTGAGPRSTPYWIDLGYGSRAEAEAADARTRYVWVYHLWPPPQKVIFDLPAWRPSSSYPAGRCN